MSKLITLFVLFAIYAGCANSTKNNSDSIDGKKLYKTNCTLCHGSNGKLGANGSKDLTKSTFTLEDRISIITNGKGAMAPYKGILSEEEIKAVAEYTLNFK